MNNFIVRVISLQNYIIVQQNIEEQYYEFNDYFDYPKNDNYINMQEMQEINKIFTSNADEVQMNDFDLGVRISFFIFIICSGIC